MNKIIKLIFVAILAVGCATSINAVTKGKAKSSASAKLTPEQFFNKWGQYYEATKAGLIEYGWPQSFFTQMQQALPNHFKMKYAASQAGAKGYVFCLIHESGQTMTNGIIVFKGGKVTECSVENWGVTDETLAEMQETLDWDMDLGQW